MLTEGGRKTLEGDVSWETSIVSSSIAAVIQSDRSIDLYKPSPSVYGFGGQYQQQQFNTRSELRETSVQTNKDTRDFDASKREGAESWRV